jgi:hypothetical protein
MVASHSKNGRRKDPRKGFNAKVPQVGETRRRWVDSDQMDALQIV